MSRLKFVKFSKFFSKKRLNSTFLSIFTKILKNPTICNDIKPKFFMRIILSTESVRIRDIWMDAQDSLNQNIKITGYPTEKNPFLLERIIKASSNEKDLVLDCFAGSGTTLDVAERLGRNFIGIDNSSEAIFNIIKRFVKGLENMGDFANKREKQSSQIKQTSLFETKGKYAPQVNLRSEFEFFSDTRYSSSAIDILANFGLIDNEKRKI